MPQFTLKRLFVSVLLIAIGAAACTAALELAALPADQVFVANLALWLVGGAFIGGGIFYLFQRAELGALVGLGVQLLAIFLLGFNR
jgi:hypothetical protein